MARHLPSVSLGAAALMPPAITKITTDDCFEACVQFNPAVRRLAWVLRCVVEGFIWWGVGGAQHPLWRAYMHASLCKTILCRMPTSTKHTETLTRAAP